MGRIILRLIKMEDPIKKAERQKLYESVVPIEVTNEVPREEYLTRLARLDRKNISQLFQGFQTLFKSTIGFMALAVGTTTFSEQYWSDLKEYLQENDPSKLSYVDRKGEDIDIILCNDGIREPHPETFFEWMDFAKKDLDRAGIDYLFESGVRNNGTSYLTVPPEYRTQEGQGVIRSKAREYSDSLRIYFPDSRDIHLSFKNMIGEIKLKYERINDNHFSLLFRHSNHYDLVNLINNLAEKD